ncbi:hypothetical protein ABFX02_09G025700 [Erythranthe guttata]
MASKDPPLIIRGKDEMREWSRSARAEGKTIGLVPTMGFLHDGHLSLIHESKKHADLTVVSIYVNPGQFSPNEDLSTYPSDFDGDIQKLNSVSGGVDVVFHPQNLYDYGGRRSSGGEEEEGKVVSCVEINGGMGHETWVRAERLDNGLCGNSRPVFFRGVATIVAKLFNIVEPDVAVFGKKDYQQWRIIKRMVSNNNSNSISEFQFPNSISEFQFFILFILGCFNGLTDLDDREIYKLWENANASVVISKKKRFVDALNQLN